MREDTVITINNGKKYLLLLESEDTTESYFLAVLLDEKEEPTNNYAVLEEVEKEGKTFIRRVSDPIILNQLLADYKSQYNDLYGDQAA